jgi:hypothetical protein
MIYSLALGFLLVCSVAAADPPVESGIVMRGEVPIALFYVDDSGTRSVVYGADMVEYCLGTIDFDIWQYKDNYLPVDEVVATLEKGEEIRTSVWPFAVFDCDLFLNVPPLATGTTSVVITDNNLYGTETDRANAWSLSAHGFLFDAMDDEWGFQHNYHCVWKGDRIKCHSKIRLR